MLRISFLNIASGLFINFMMSNLDFQFIFKLNNAGKVTQNAAFLCQIQISMPF